MTRIKMILILVASIGALKSSPGCPVVDDLNSGYPPPRVKLRYMSDPFTRELVMSKSFKDNELVPIQIELIKPEFEDEHAHDLYLTIESIEVIFAVQESVPRTRTKFKGHLVLIPLHWASKFTLEKGSRIVFNIKYNYNQHDKVVEAGEITEEIRL
jgi:hypothetical protein